jgi:hypothetical protein
MQRNIAANYYYFYFYFTGFSDEVKLNFAASGNRKRLR